MVKLQTVEFSTCLKPTEMTRELRQIVVNHGWKYERIDGVRTVDRFAIVLPITQLAKSLGIKGYYKMKKQELLDAIKLEEEKQKPVSKDQYHCVLSKKDEVLLNNLFSSK